MEYANVEDLGSYLSRPCTAFEGFMRLAQGPLIEVVLAVKSAVDTNGLTPILVFDDSTGRTLEFDLRGTTADVVARLPQHPVLSAGAVAVAHRAVTDNPQAAVAETRGRGRPKLGVVGREVTLLPRQWEWLSAQPGGASVVIRKLVDEAKRSGGASEKTRTAQEAAYRFMATMAGDLPGFEEATRALFAGDRTAFAVQVADWPEHIRAYATRLACGTPAGTLPDAKT